MQPSQDRFHELDSMRGIAALIVLFHHFTYMFYPAVFRTADWRSAMLYPLIAGRESVIFFFVLSGFVLALPYLRGRSQAYPTFLWRRVLRIYGPYLGALALAVAGCSIWHNKLGSTGWAAATWDKPVDLRSVVEHILFIGSYNYSRYNTAFWSLVYEMRISIVFPLLFLAAYRLRLRYALLLMAACTLISIPAMNGTVLITFEYAAVFMIGILLAKHLHSIKDAYRGSAAWKHWLLVLLSMLLYEGGHLVTDHGPLRHLGDMPVAIGAAGLVVVGINSRSAQRILNAPAPAFLGKISYSFYLVHATVLFAMAAALKGKIDPPEFLILCLPSVILLSWGFYHAVELPFMQMSRKVGQRANNQALSPKTV